MPFSVTHETIPVSHKRKGTLPKELPPVHTATIEQHDGEIDESTERHHTIVYMGMGNESEQTVHNAAKAMAEASIRFALNTDVGTDTPYGRTTLVSAVPFWAFDGSPNVANLAEFAGSIVTEVARQVYDGPDIADKRHTLGESQGLVGALEAVSQDEDEEIFNGRFGSVHGLGLAPGILTIPRFTYRLGVTALQNPLTIAAARVGARAFQRGTEDAVHGGPQIKSAGDYDGRPALAKIRTRGNGVARFVGRYDRLLPDSETQAKLDEVGLGDIPSYVGPGAHESFVTGRGALIGARAVHWTQTGLLPENDYGRWARLQQSSRVLDKRVAQTQRV